MRLLQRARSSYALSLILCAVLLGALAVPAMAANGDARSKGQASQSQAEARKERAKEKKEAARAKRAEAAAKSSSASSTKASNQGKSSSAAKSSNASAKGQSASAAKAGNGKSEANGSASTAPKAEKPAKAEKQGEDKAKAGENSPAGNKGSMKVRPVGTAAHPPRNYAHLPCVVQVDFYGSPHTGATLTAVSHAPTSPTGQTLLTKTMSFSQTSPNPRGNELVGTTTLDFTSVVSGLTYHEQQGYHVKLTAEQDGPQGANVKHKVFWIDCPPPPPAVDESSQEQIETEDAAVVAGEVEVETESATGEVQGVSDSEETENTEVAGVTVEREEVVAAAEGRVLGTSGALAPRDNAKVLAATGIGVLALTLLGLAGLGGGAGILRRFRKN